MDTADAVHIIAVSPWELTFEHHLGLLEGRATWPTVYVPRLPGPPRRRRPRRMGRAAAPAHAYPFDRLLVAQAHRPALVMRIALIPQYDVTDMRV
ncbi:PIN domain nuclease [Streptomyces sp. YPW6]|uniref:PIN domain nuclease n=1 Tax=Streptomyces sp. YPW6 TaxID=2840373 RepID=UPI003D727C20